jgi:F0F1-type ATP synthase epsilon subunit
MQEFLLEVRSLEEIFIKEHVEWASFPMQQGQVTIYAGHAPIMGEVIEGELKYGVVSGEIKSILIGSGFAQVHQDRVILLV